MLAVQLIDIQKRYHDHPVLRSIGLQVRPGEYLVLLGESGCGKTTMLRTIAGLESPDGGRVQIGDVDVTAVASRKRDVSMLFQRDGLYPHMTLRQTMAFPMKGLISSVETQRRIERAAELLGLDAILDRHPEHLSGGELRRAGLAKMVVREAAIRLLDEPLSGLDGPIRHQFQRDLLRWHREIPGTTIHVTHDGDEAMRMADRVAVMHRGQIVQVATPTNLYHHPCCLAVAKSLGSPPINVLRGELRRGELHVPGSMGRVRFDPAADQHGVIRSGPGEEEPREVHAAIRPESFMLAEPHGADGATASDLVFSVICRSSLVYRGQCHACFETQGQGQGHWRQGQWLDALLPAACGVRPGDTLMVAVKLADLLLFDAAGQRIERAA